MSFHSATEPSPWNNCSLEIYVQQFKQHMQNEQVFLIYIYNKTSNLWCELYKCPIQSCLSQKTASVIGVCRRTQYAARYDTPHMHNKATEMHHANYFHPWCQKGWGLTGTKRCALRTTTYITANNKAQSFVLKVTKSLHIKAAYSQHWAVLCKQHQSAWETTCQ